MNLKSKNYSLPYIVALTTIVILAVFSIFAYKERMLFLDPAWVVYNIINTKFFCFSEYRYGAFITQLFPLAGTYLVLSLKTILLLYSFSFYLFYLSAALIIGSIFNQKWLVILLALYLTLFVSDVYYWPNNEVHQGITWMLLFVGLYLFQSDKKHTILYVTSAIFALLAISSHLLVSVPLLFLWIYIHLDTNLKTLTHQKTFTLYSILLVVGMILRYKLSDEGWYDHVKLIGVQNLSYSGAINAFMSGQAKSFVSLLFTNYWIALPIFCLSSFLLLRQKRYLQWTTLTVFALGYFVLICVTFPDAFARNLRFYMESEWTALAIIVSTPAAIWAINYKNAHVILLLIFTIRMVYIFASYHFFHHRYTNLETALNTIQGKNLNKVLVIDGYQKAQETFIMDWGLPIESMMLSNIQGDKIQSTFKVVYDNPQIIQAKDSLYSSFNIQSMEILNTQYFNLDTTKRYEVIEGLDGLINK